MLLLLLLLLLLRGGARPPTSMVVPTVSLSPFTERRVMLPVPRSPFTLNLMLSLFTASVPVAGAESARRGQRLSAS